jgi:type I restriction enzyme S subunit
LGEVADVQLGKMLDTKRTEGTSLPYLRNVNVRWGRIDVSDLLEMPFKDRELERYAVRSGDVMVCEGGEPGRAAVWRRDDQDIKYQKALHRVRLRGGLLPDWLVYQLDIDASSGRLAKQFTGTTIGHLPREAIVEYQLRLAPLPEQHRIVEAIESSFTRLDAAVATLERAQRNLKRYRASMLKAAVEGRLVPTEAELARAENRDYEPASVFLLGRNREKPGQKKRAGRLWGAGVVPDLNDEERAALPEGWCWAKVHDLGPVPDEVVQVGPMSMRSKDFADTGVAVLNVGCVQWGYIDESKAHRLPDAQAEKERGLLRIGVCPNTCGSCLRGRHTFAARPAKHLLEPHEQASTRCCSRC